MGRLLRLAAVAALGGLASAGVVGCSRGGGETSSSFPGVVIPSPSVVASPTPTVLSEDELLALIPEEARTEDFPGAVNFSRFFLGLYAPMYGPEHDIAPFEFFCSEDSIFCSDSLAGARENASEGAYSEGGDFTWSNDDIGGGLQADGTWNVSQSFNVTDTTTYRADGTVHNVVRGGAGRVGMELDFVEGHWRVLGVNFEFDDE